MFEELDRQPTERGEISLRRRHDPTLDVELVEVRLDEEFLMSSLFTVAEEELARLTLAEVAGAGPLAVLVGGLGLGCTAVAALEDVRVEHLWVVEAAPAVIDWHRRGLVPHGATLTASHRCELVHGDFFAAVTAPGAAPGGPTGEVDAILLDIDHSPRLLLHPDHGRLYTEDGLGEVAGRLRPGGAFGLWSDEPPDDAFLDLLARPFATAVAHVVEFPNPYTAGTSANTVYVATAPT